MQPPQYHVAKNLEFQGAFREALSSYEDLLRQQDPQLKVLLLASICRCQVRLGHFSIALESAYEGISANEGGTKSDQAILLIRLAAVYAGLEDFGMAEEYCAQAWNIVRAKTWDRVKAEVAVSLAAVALLRDRPRIAIK